jgi:hypothetical protein
LQLNEEIVKLNSKKIWVLDVAEAENLLLLENVIKAVATHMGKDADDVFEKAKANLIASFKTQQEQQIILHYKELLGRKLALITNFTSTTISGAISEVDLSYSSIDKQKLFNEIKIIFEEAISKSDYDAVLRLFNLKNALIPFSKVCEMTEIKNKEGYLNLVLSLLKKQDAASQVIKKAIEDKIIRNAS